MGVIAYIVIVVEGGPLLWAAHIQCAVCQGISQGLCSLKALHKHTGNFAKCKFSFHATMLLGVITCAA